MIRKFIDGSSFKARYEYILVVNNTYVGSEFNLLSIHESNDNKKKWKMTCDVMIFRVKRYYQMTRK